MDIKGAENKLEQADSFLTRLEKLFKKHWFTLLLILVGYFFYWAFTTDFPEESTTTEPYVTEEYYEYQNNGDSILIEVWSDGTETIVE